MEYAPDRDPGTWQVKSYKTVADASPIETVGMSVGGEGTDLGTIGSKPDGNMNSIYRCAYGYNRWSQSALRQYLNGKGTNWWKPQNKWDRPPEYVGKHGFLDGIPAEELSVMRRVKVVTGVPYCEEGTANEPVLDTTYDLVFLPSLEEHFLALNESGMKGKEGEAWSTGRESRSPRPAGAVADVPAADHLRHQRQDQPAARVPSFRRSRLRQQRVLRVRFWRRQHLQRAERVSLRSRPRHLIINNHPGRATAAPLPIGDRLVSAQEAEEEV